MDEYQHWREAGKPARQAEMQIFAVDTKVIFCPAREHERSGQVATVRLYGRRDADGSLHRIQFEDRICLWVKPHELKEQS